MTENQTSKTTMRSPLVSVIMNCYNGERYLREAIDSVFAQSYENWEIIFLDNASTDGSGDIARSYGKKVRYFCNDQTTSLGAARNAAIDRAEGELIAFLDTDDRWLSDKLDLQVATFRELSDVDFIYGNYYTLQADSGRTAVGLLKSQPEGEVFRDFLRYYPANLQTVMVRSSALRKLDELFDPILEVSEEYDFFMRLLFTSKAAYLKNPTAVYRVHSQMSSIRNIEKYPVENNYILGKLRAMIPDLDRLFPQEVAYLEAKIGYWHAAAHMHKGDNANARASLKPYRWQSATFLMLYLATFFPSSIWNALQQARRLVR